jgi:hypothetical protein
MADQEKRRRLVWEIDKKLQKDEARYAATCMQPQLKVLTIMVNSQYNSWRIEDVWLDLRLCCCGGVATATRRSWNIGRSRPEPPPSPALERRDLPHSGHCFVICGRPLSGKGKRWGRVGRGRMLSSVRPMMRQDDSRRPVWEFADRLQITRSVLEAQWKALVVPAPSRRLLRHTLLPLALTSSRSWSA